MKRTLTLNLLQSTPGASDLNLQATMLFLAFEAGEHRFNQVLFVVDARRRDTRTSC